MARRIYGILVLAALGLGSYLHTQKDVFSNGSMMVLAGLVFMIFSMGVHGLIAHSINTKLKGGILLYPVLMGVLWALLFFLFVFLVLPNFCPDFAVWP